METPIVKETSALSAHRREVDLVRWSLVAVPEGGGDRDRRPDPRDPLRGMDSTTQRALRSHEAA